MQWIVHDVSTLREVHNRLCWDRPALIISEWDLPDGTWREILSLIAPFPDPPPLLVASSVIDDARWAEVLYLGAYDMLAKPFDKNEVVRVAGLANAHRTPAYRCPVTMRD